MNGFTIDEDLSEGEEEIIPFDPVVDSFFLTREQKRQRAERERLEKDKKAILDLQLEAERSRESHRLVHESKKVHPLFERKRKRSSSGSEGTKEILVLDDGERELGVSLDCMGDEKTDLLRNVHVMGKESDTIRRERIHPDWIRAVDETIPQADVSSSLDWRGTIFPNRTNDARGKKWTGRNLVVDLDPVPESTSSKDCLRLLGAALGGIDGKPEGDETAMARSERWKEELKWYVDHVPKELSWRAGSGGELQWMPSGPNPLWIEKYRPSSSLGICDNQEAKTLLKEWLQEWKDNPNRASESSQLLQRKKLHSDPWDLEEDPKTREKEGTSIVQKGGEAWCSSGILLIGPCASGKTSLVYACAEDMGFQVREVSTSDRRTGRDLLNLIGEATQSRRLDYAQEPPCVEVGGRSAVDAHPMAAEQDAVSSKATLLLVEDIDIIFEEDRGFAAALANLIRTAKRPMVLTCSSRRRPWLSREVRLVCLETRLPSPEEMLPVLTFIAHAEHLPISFKPQLLLRLAHACGCDLRRCILELQSLKHLESDEWERKLLETEAWDSLGISVRHVIQDEFCRLPARSAPFLPIPVENVSSCQKIFKAVQAARAAAEEGLLQRLLSGRETRLASAWGSTGQEEAQDTSSDGGDLIPSSSEKSGSILVQDGSTLPDTKPAHSQHALHVQGSNVLDSPEYEGLDEEERLAVRIAVRAIAMAVGGRRNESDRGNSRMRSGIDPSSVGEVTTTPSHAVDHALARLRREGLPFQHLQDEDLHRCWNASDLLSLADCLSMSSKEGTAHGPRPRRTTRLLDGVGGPGCCITDETDDGIDLDVAFCDRVSAWIAGASSSCMGVGGIVSTERTPGHPRMGNPSEESGGRDGHVDPSTCGPTPTTWETLWSFVRMVSPSLAVRRSEDVLCDVISFGARIARWEEDRYRSSTHRQKKNFWSHMRKCWDVPSEYDSYLSGFGRYTFAREDGDVEVHA